MAAKSANPIERVDLEGMDLSDLAEDEEALDEIEEDADYLAIPPPIGSPEVDKGALYLDAAANETPAGMVMLWNLKYPNEEFWDLTGDKDLQGFMDGQWVTTQKIADEVMRRAGDHIYIEPSEGQAYYHEPTKFRTRSFEAYIARRDMYERELG